MSNVLLGTLEINDGSTYRIDIEGVNLGNRQTTWDEVTSYTGTANAQVNINSRGLIPVILPMTVKGSSVSDLESKLASLWAEVPDGVVKSTNTLNWYGTSYSIVISTRPDTILRDPFFQLNFTGRFTLVLMRTP